MNIPFTPFTAVDREATQPILPADSLSIRPAALRDLSQLADLLAQSFHTNTGIAGWFYPVFRLGIYEDLRLRLRSGGAYYTCLVAIAQIPSSPRPICRLVGTVEMARRSSNLWLGDRGASLYLSNLAVKAEYRRQGIALQLLDACEQIALGWGFDKLYLHVLENNQRARQLYTKAGFRPQRQRDCLLFQWLVQPKRLLLQKSLTPIYRATGIGSR